ncbi:hypothetical protein ES706_05997 [subsurface metagenome]
MAVFEQDVAILLQHVAVPLETTGLILAIIEVKFSHIARRIEQRIDDISAAPFRKVWDEMKDVVEGATSEKIISLSRVLALVTWIIGIGVGLVKQSWLWGIGTVLLVGFCTMMGVPLLIALLSRVLGVLDEVCDGHALGGLGISLAGMGFLMEVYQVLTIYLAAA